MYCMDGNKYIDKYEVQPSTGPSNLVTNEMLIEKLCFLTNKLDSIRTTVNQIGTKVDNLEHLASSIYNSMNNNIDGIYIQL